MTAQGSYYDPEPQTPETPPHSAWCEPHAVRYRGLCCYCTNPRLVPPQRNLAPFQGRPVLGSAERRTLARELYAAGLNIQQIAGKIGVSRPTVREYLRAAPKEPEVA
jgi:hypothetical protein